MPKHKWTSRNPVGFDGQAHLLLRWIIGDDIDDKDVGPTHPGVHGEVGFDDS